MYDGHSQPFTRLYTVWIGNIARWPSVRACVERRVALYFKSMPFDSNQLNGMIPMHYSVCVYVYLCHSIPFILRYNRLTSIYLNEYLEKPIIRLSFSFSSGIARCHSLMLVVRKIHLKTIHSNTSPLRYQHCKRVCNMAYLSIYQSVFKYIYYILPAFCTMATNITAMCSNTASHYITTTIAAKNHHHNDDYDDNSNNKMSVENLNNET